MRVSITSRNLAGFFAILLIIASWQLAATRLKLPLILPSPKETWVQILKLISSGDFWRHLGATLTRGLVGFSLSLVIGVGLGVITGRFTWMGAFFRPIIICIRSTPVMSIIILAIIWFKSGFVPIFVTFLMVFPIVVQNIIEGIQNISPQLQEMFTLYRIGLRGRLLNLYFPSLLPFLTTAISSGLGITWKVLLAAEVLAYPAWGIGTQMDNARVFLQTDKVFAFTVIVVIIGLVFDYLLDFLLCKPFLAWKGKTND